MKSAQLLVRAMIMASTVVFVVDVTQTRPPWMMTLSAVYHMGANRETRQTNYNCGVNLRVLTALFVDGPSWRSLFYARV
jgi:hypothetical protein